MTMMMKSQTLLLIASLLQILGVSHALAVPQKRLVSIVTGANGYLGREIVHNLRTTTIVTSSDDNKPAASHEILCLVREKHIQNEEQYWEGCNGDDDCSSNAQVHVMAYDMLDGGQTLSNALDRVYDGTNTKCCVYHVASVFTPTEEHKQMALDNVKGAEDLVKTIATYNQKQQEQTTTSTRIVLTSSMAAVRGSGQEPLNGKWYTHKDWNTQSELGAGWGASYQWSKAESEKRALNLANEMNIPFTSICPPFIFGPPAGGKQSNSFSLSFVQKWLTGDAKVESRLFADLRDVARAHVLAGQRESTIGERIIASCEARISSTDMAVELKRIAEESGLGDSSKIIPDTDFDGGAIKIGDREVECEERMKELFGDDYVEFRSPKETMADMAKVLLQMHENVASTL